MFFIELKSEKKIIGAVEVFKINTLGPILTAKHFTSIFEKQNKTIMCILSARVGSIEDKGLKQTVVDQLKSVYLQIDADDIPYVKKEYLTFAKNQKVKDALLKSVDLLKAGNYDKIIDTMMAASKVGVENDLGMDYIDNFESIMEDVKRFSVSTGWDVIDELKANGAQGILVCPIEKMVL